MDSLKQSDDFGNVFRSDCDSCLSHPGYFTISFYKRKCAQHTHSWTLTSVFLSLKGGLSDPTLEKNCLSKKHPEESPVCPVYRARQGLPEEEGKSPSAWAQCTDHLMSLWLYWISSWLSRLIHEATGTTKTKLWLVWLLWLMNFWLILTCGLNEQTIKTLQNIFFRVA